MLKQIDHFFSIPLLLKMALITLTFSLLAAIIIGSCFYAKFSTDRAVQASAIIKSGDFSTTNREILSSLGTYGDFMGGTLNPLISFMGLIGSLIALFYIKKTYDKQREEIDFLKNEQLHRLISDSLNKAESTLQAFIPSSWSDYSATGNRDVFLDNLEHLIMDAPRILVSSENITIDILKVIHIINLIGEANRYGEANAIRYQHHTTILLCQLIHKLTLDKALIIIILTERHRESDFFKIAHQCIPTTKLLQQIPAANIEKLLESSADPSSDISNKITRNQNRLATYFLEAAKRYDRDAFGTNTRLFERANA